LLETERLRLRRPTLDDTENVLELVSDPLVMEFIDEPTRDPAEVREALERWLARWRADGFGHFFVERRDDGAFVGRTGLLVWDMRTWQTSTFAEVGGHGQLELGWMFARAHWGHGYATESARAVRDWAFAQGAGSLISLIHPDNVRSQRVAEKLGAVPTETLVVEEKPAVVWRHPPAHEPAR